jgi:dTDP-4-amino-4,6-dideoxygalactose transaminase
MRKHYRVAGPYFTEADISWIQKKIPVVLKSQLSTGPFMGQLEEEFAEFVGTRYAVCLNSCTSALEIALKALGLRQGDEVIVPAQTFIASGMAVTLGGGEVVFAEINPDSFCLDLAEIKRRMTRRTRGVILVHFCGNMSKDTLEIRRFCRANGLFLIEDSAHAHGSRIDGKMAGSIGDAGCFSFSATKVMTMSEGGMITTDSRRIRDFALSFRERGQSLYTDRELFSFPWRSCRVPEISALLGLRQLASLEKAIGVRNRIAKVYGRHFADAESIHTLTIPANVRSSYWKHITVIDDRRIRRERVRELLKRDYNIDINWAYDPPMHLQPVYRKMYGTRKGALAATEDISSRHFHLPMHLGISAKDAAFVARSTLAVMRKLGRS